VLGVDKGSGDALDPFNRTGGVDTRLVLHKNLVLHGYAAAAGSNGISTADSDLGVDLSYVTDWMQFEGMQNRRGAGLQPRSWIREPHRHQ
jgi:hypothetical protein